MIGVIADSSEHDVIREFFELFKTPWEFFRQGQNYDVLLCAGNCRFEATAKLIVVYATQRTDFDETHLVSTSHEYHAPRFLTGNNDRFPIYGSTLTFVNQAGILLRDEFSQECAGYLEETGNQSCARVGYDLFEEIRTLLTDGQPVANAQIPTLELHINFLRNLIISCGIPLVEIPPVPDGYQFIACLTHDVDHPSIRLHKWDHTVFGFVYRATLGSLKKFVGGQISLRDLFKNWLAVLKLPFVYMGFAEDFWREFAEQYRHLEQGFRSTFFIIPCKNRPGVAADGPAPAFRASGYGAQDIADIIRGLGADGHEVGLHGIDAWADSSKGRDEIKEILQLTGATETGVRMHWLYYDKNTPEKLEKAGASYDSTFGYNETVGYRAGTTQVYKPLQTKQLLELPMHVMDTALFYPSRLELSRKQAAAVLDQLQDNATHFGGVLTVNWHDRSVAPERLWGAIYQGLLENMKQRDAWLCAAGQAVSWFRMRRSATFEIGANGQGTVSVKVPTSRANNRPQLKLRTYQPSLSAKRHSQPSPQYFDSALGAKSGATVTSGTSA